MTKPLFAVALLIFLLGSVAVLAPKGAHADTEVSPGQYIVVEGASGCALDSDSKLICWGAFRNISPQETFEQVFWSYQGAHYEFSRRICALSVEGNAACWDSSGNRKDTYDDSKYAWASDSPLIRCALSLTGGVRCGEAAGVWWHMEEPPLGKYIQVSAGEYACGLTTARSVRCWGVRHNDPSDPSNPYWVPYPTQSILNTGQQYLQIAVYGAVACALSTEGDIDCWDGANGALGWFSSDTTFTMLDYGSPCAITEQGGIVCRENDDTVTLAESGYTQVARYGNSMCAATVAGTLECFGSGAAQLPDQLTQPGSVLQPKTTALGGNSARVSEAQPVQIATAARLDGPTGGHVTSSAGVAESGDTVTLTARPDDGYRFVRWDGDASGTQNPLTLRPDAHIFVTAVFEPAVSEYRVRAAASPAAGGDVRGLGNGVFEQGEEAVLTALPSDGYRFVRWRGDASGADNPLVFFVARDISVTAEFQPLDEQEEEDLRIHDPSCSVDDIGVLGLTYYNAGSLPDGSCRDRINGGYAKIYRFRVDEPTELTIEQDADGFYPLFYLIDTSNTLHAEAEGLLRDSVARASATLTAGSYDLVVTTQDTNENGSYELDLFAGAAKSPLVRLGELSETESAITDTGRVTLFTSRTFPDQNWQIGQPLNLTLPAARFGSGFYTYTIKYEWNGDQTWTPAGVVFDRNTLRFFGAPRLTLDPNPGLRRFTVFLRADDRLHSDEWDELSFAVDLQAATPSPSVAQSGPPPLAFPRIAIPTSLMPETRVETADAVAVRLAARMRSDGRPEFALALEGAPLNTRTWLEIPSISAIRQTTSWLMSPDVLLNGEPIGRISVRQAAKGQLELGFVPASETAPILPESRFLYRPLAGSKGTHLSAVLRIPAPQGCRASESDNGIAFPTRRVKLHANHATEYLVSGLGTNGGQVTYLVCANGQKITDDTRDKALFTAGYFYSTAPEFDFHINFIRDQVETAERGLRIYQRGFKERAWANIVRGSAVASYAALSLYFHSPHSLEEALAVSLKEVAEIADVPVLSKVLSTAQSASPTKAIRLTRGVLEDLAEEPHEVVAKIALQHVYSAVGAGQPWLNATRGARVGDDMLFFPSAHLNRTLEYLIAAGAVGDVLATAVKNSNVAAWKEALHATIPSQLDEELWFLWDAGSQLLDGGLESLHEWFFNYPDYKQLSNTHHGATVIVAQRHQELAVRLGLSALPTP